MYQLETHEAKGVDILPLSLVTVHLFETLNKFLIHSTSLLVGRVT